MRLLSLFGLLALLPLAACSESNPDPDDDDDTPSLGSVSLTADGDDYDSDAAGAGRSGGSVAVTAALDDDSYPSIAMGFPDAEGTYNLASAGGTAAISFVTGSTGADSYVAGGGFGSGSIVVTDVSAGNVQGTFNGVVQNGAGDTITITSGEFDVDLAN